MKELIVAISIAKDKYAFDASLAKQTLLEHINLEKSFLENVNFTSPELMRRRIALSHLKLLYIAMDQG